MPEQDPGIGAFLSTLGKQKEGPPPVQLGQIEAERQRANAEVLVPRTPRKAQPEPKPRRKPRGATAPTAQKPGPDFSTFLSQLSPQQKQAPSPVQAPMTGATAPTAQKPGPDFSTFLSQLSPQQKQAPSPVQAPMTGAALIPMPDYVRKSIDSRTAQASVPRELQDPRAWPEDYKRKLLDPNSMDSKLHKYDTEKYGMPTFGYLSDPQRDRYKRQMELTAKPGNVYSEAKAIDSAFTGFSGESFLNPGSRQGLPPDVRQAAIGYMWLKFGLKSDGGNVPPGTGAALGKKLSDPSSWPAFKTEVERMKSEREELEKRPELHFLIPSERRMTVTMRLQQDPTTIQGAMALYDLANGRNPTFGYNESADRRAYRLNLHSKMDESGSIPPGYVAGHTQNEALSKGRSMEDVNDAAERVGLPGTRTQTEAPFAEDGKWRVRGTDGAVRDQGPRKHYSPLELVQGLGSLASLSVKTAARMGLVGIAPQEELATHGATPFASEEQFNKGWQESVTGTLSDTVAEVVPYAIPYLGPLAGVQATLQQAIDGGLPAIWEGTGVPAALATFHNPNSTWQERTRASVPLLFAGLMLWHGKKLIKKVLPVKLPVDGLRQEWLAMPPEVLYYSKRIRQEILSTLHESGATDPAKLEDHATSGATMMTRAALNIEKDGGRPAAESLANVRIEPDGTLSVPDDIAVELNKVSATLDKEAEIVSENPPAPTGPKPAEGGGTHLGETHYWTTNHGKQTARDEIWPISRLKPSHSYVTFEPIKEFPADLQPRSRDRQSPKMQIERIAREFDKDRALDEFRNMTDGTPIVMPDGTVISGNGRTMAMQLLADGHGNQAEWAQYQLTLRNLLGLPPTDTGVYVRVRVADVDHATAKMLAEEGNKSPAAAMGQVETAKSDAGKLPENFWQSFNPVGQSFDRSVNSPQNRGLVNRFINQFPESELSGLLAADGSVAVEGLMRLKRAALIDLLGEKGGPLAERIFESSEESARLTQGLFLAMPDLLKNKSPELSDALNAIFDEYTRFQTSQDAQGWTWEEFKSQGQLHSLPEDLVDAFHALGDAVTTGGSGQKVGEVLREIVSSGKFRDIAAKLSGQDNLFSKTTKKPYIVARNMQPSFGKAVENNGGTSLGEGYYALRNDANGRAVIEQMGLQVDRPRTNDYNRRYADQPGMFDEEQASPTPVEPEPTTGTLFSKSKSEETSTAGVSELGRIEFDADGKSAIIKLGPGATIAEVVHEASHYLRRTLSPETTAQVELAIGVEKGKWSVANEERFARSFEKYLTEQASIPGLDPVMAQLALAVRDVYATRPGGIAGQSAPHIGKGKLEVPASLKAVFDSFTTNPSKWPGMAPAPAPEQTENPADTVGPLAPEPPVQSVAEAKGETAPTPKTGEDAPVVPRGTTGAEAAPVAKPSTKGVFKNTIYFDSSTSLYEARRNGDLKEGALIAHPADESGGFYYFGVEKGRPGMYDKLVPLHDRDALARWQIHVTEIERSNTPEGIRAKIDELKEALRNETDREDRAGIRGEIAAQKKRLEAHGDAAETEKPSPLQDTQDKIDDIQENIDELKDALENETEPEHKTDIRKEIAVLKEREKVLKEREKVLKKEIKTKKPTDKTVTDPESAQPERTPRGKKPAEPVGKTVTDPESAKKSLETKGITTETAENGTHTLQFKDYNIALNLDDAALVRYAQKIAGEYPSSFDSGIAIPKRTPKGKKPADPDALSSKLTDYADFVRDSLTAHADDVRDSRRKLRNFFIENTTILSQVAPESAKAAWTLGASRAKVQVLMQAAVPAIDEAAGQKGYFATLRKVLTESRLLGAKDRWESFAREVEKMDDIQFVAQWGYKWSQIAENLGSEEALTVLIASGVEDAAKDGFVTLLDDAAARVKSVMGRAEFEAEGKTPEFKRALEVYQREFEAALNESHAKNEGVFSDSLGPHKTYYPLAPLDELGKPLRPARGAKIGNDGRRFTIGRRAPLQKNKNQRNQFTTGHAPDYGTDAQSFADSVTKAFYDNDRAKLIDRLEQDGILRRVNPGIPAQDNPTINIDGVEYAAKILSAGPNKQVKVPVWLGSEIGHLLESKGDLVNENISGVLHKINEYGLVGPLDAAFHASNLVGVLVASTPHLPGGWFSKSIGNTPLTKMVNSLLQISQIRVGSETVLAELKELADFGGLPTKSMSVTISKKYSEEYGAELKRWSLAPALYGPNGLDVKARIVMLRIAKEVNPKATPHELAKFVNQLGAYNPAIEAQLERMLKGSGIAPFYTAGKTMYLKGLNANTMTTELPTSGLSKAKVASLRVQQQISGGLAGYLGTWAVAYYAARAKWPWEEEGSEVGKIPLGNGKSVSIDFLDPIVGRGLRALGVRGFADTMSAGGTLDQAVDAGFKDVVNSALHPFVSGPVVQGLSVAATGFEPHLTSVRDLTGRGNLGAMRGAPDVGGGVEQIAKNAAYGALSVNSFYKDMAESFGLVQPTYPERAGEDRIDLIAESVLAVAFPRLLSETPDIAIRKERLEKQAKATESATDETIWQIVKDDVGKEAEHIVKKYRLAPKPHKRRRESEDDFNARVKNMAKNWSLRLESIKARELPEEAERRLAREATDESFRSPRGG